MQSCLCRSSRLIFGTMIRIITGLFQGMIALRRGAMEVIHEDYIDGKFVLVVSFCHGVFVGVMEVQAKKKKNLIYYA